MAAGQRDLLSDDDDEDKTVKRKHGFTHVFFLFLFLTLFLLLDIFIAILLFISKINWLGLICSECVISYFLFLSFIFYF